MFRHFWENTVLDSCFRLFHENQCHSTKNHPFLLIFVLFWRSKFQLLAANDFKVIRHRGSFSFTQQREKTRFCDFLRKSYFQSVVPLFGNFFCSTSERAHFTLLETVKDSSFKISVTAEQYKKIVTNISWKVATFTGCTLFSHNSAALHFKKIVFTRFCRELNEKSFGKKFGSVGWKPAEL